MKEDSREIETLLTMAEEELAITRLLIQKGFWRVAISRAYYSMFNAARALLLERGLELTSHRGVIAAFGKELVKGEGFPRRYHKALVEAFSERQISDYSLAGRAESKVAESFFEDAEAFLNKVKEFIGG